MHRISVHHLYKICVLRCRIFWQAFAASKTKSLLARIKESFSLSVFSKNKSSRLVAAANNVLLISAYLLHRIKQCSSFSISIASHKTHTLSSSLSPTYRPVSILSGAVPHLNLAKDCLLFLDNTFFYSC